MSDRVVIDRVPPYDGEWEFDLERRELSTREWGWIKRLSGYLPLNIEEGYGDPELIVVFACIALRRAGKIDTQDVPRVFGELSDAPYGTSIRLLTEPATAGGDAGPPPPSSTVNGGSSGQSSGPSSETSPATPNRSGTPASATSASAPATSVTSPPGS